MSIWLRITFFLTAAVGAILLIVLAAGGASYAQFERDFPVLLAVNLFAILTLFAFVVAIFSKIIKRWRAGAFGSRMTASLATMLSVSAIVPCVLIYLVSSQFIGRSIDSWFDVRIEKALDSGVSLSSGLIDREQGTLLLACRRIASILSATARQERTLALDRMRETANADSAIIFNADGSILVSSLAPNGQPVIDKPTSEQFKKAAAENGIHILDGDQSESIEPLRIRAVVPIPHVSGTQSQTFLQLTQFVPTEVASRANDLVQGYRDYQELVLSRQALRSIYGMTLTLTMVLALLASMAAALSFARAMTAPVLQLAAGTKKVAEGDLRPIKEFSGSSEINALTRSFNSMVTQIAEARQIVEMQRQGAERAREQLERILGNLSSGVLVLDHDFQVLMCNEATGEILKTELIAPDMNLADISSDFARKLSEEIQITDDEDDIRFELELTRPDLRAPVSLFVRAARTQLESGSGWVVVFDDISGVLAAQRAVAWGEVARRLAHEIKNPLTPIRLAAERLEFKLASKLDEHDAALLKRTSNTIITQVDAMKQMVNDFRDYAKLPTANLVPTNLNAFLEDLTAFYATAGTRLDVRIEADLPPILADAAQLRQVMHNLIGNAVDATETVAEPAIGLTVTKVRAEGGAVTALRIVLEDNGPGFAPNILAKAFEPYTTTKPTGTGLGLSMVKKIVDEHHAKIVLSNKTDGTNGAQIVMIFPVPASVAAIPEAPDGEDSAAFPAPSHQKN